jgi:hypothetical protein
MDPLTTLNAVNAGLALVDALLPELQKLQLNGQISVEQQQDMLSRYNSLKARADGQFKGREWQIDPPTAGELTTAGEPSRE